MEKAEATKENQPEPHLANIRQLTFSGKNAEAYFSPDGYKLVYQSTLDPSAFITKISKLEGST